MAASAFRHAVHGVIEFANQRVDGNCGTVAETPGTQTMARLKRRDTDWNSEYAVIAGGDFFP